MNSVVRLSEMKHGTVTHEDREYFTSFRVGYDDDADKYLAEVEYDTTSEDYFLGWVERNNATILTGKNCIYGKMKMEVGGTQERISDSFKFTTFVLLVLEQVYSLLTAQQKNNMNQTIRQLMDDYVTFHGSNPNFFPLENVADMRTELARILREEKKISGFIDNAGNIGE